MAIIMRNLLGNSDNHRAPHTPVALRIIHPIHQYELSPSMMSSMSEIGRSSPSHSRLHGGEATGSGEVDGRPSPITSDDDKTIPMFRIAGERARKPGSSLHHPRGWRPQSPRHGSR